MADGRHSFTLSAVVEQLMEWVVGRITLLQVPKTSVRIRVLIKLPTTKREICLSSCITQKLTSVKRRYDDVYSQVLLFEQPVHLVLHNNLNIVTRMTYRVQPE